jgi:flagellar basal-body rod modification protein FlgD
MDPSQLAISHSTLVSASQTVASALGPKSHAASTYSAASAGASGTSPTSTTPASNSSTITASDFLTLLVSELKNQDPTQPTDPNAYITQMVGVNSLQQLISINQGITSLGSTSGTTPTGK